jgi:hypothetical protein
MMNPEEQFQDRLSRLEMGEPLESCAADLPANEVELLKVVTALQAIVYPTQAAESIAAQRAVLLETAERRRGDPLLPVRTPLFPPGRWNMLKTSPKSARVAALAAAIVVLIAGLLLLRPAAPGPSTNSAAAVVQNVPLNPPAKPYTQFVPLVSSTKLAAAEPGSAVVTEARGLVELQTGGGQWTPILTGQTLSAGQHLRTQNLSSAALLFYDGSRTQLGPATEVALEKLNAQTNGPRTIVLAQLSGSTDHQVAHSSDPASRYEVHTLNGDSLAKGTRFRVSLSQALATRVDVEEGIVTVINVNITVQVTAGQVTTIQPGAPPATPAFHITGEGIVTHVGEVWRISGLDFHATDTTVIVGNPQLGDRVAVDGHLAPDGTRIADMIVLVDRALQNRFAFSGAVGTSGGAQWTIAGRAVQVDQNTRIDTGIHSGDLVAVEGAIKSDGTLLAKSIRLLTAGGLRFEFTGLVQQIGAAAWTVSGVTLVVTDTTEIEAGLQIGSLVKVEGTILPDGTWLAAEIKRAPEFENRFEFSGVVQSLDPWRVSGITFTTNTDTEIDAGIEIGDRVKVEGRVLADGTWLAEEVRLLDDQALTFEFVGRVTHIDPWIVSGITFTVNSSTTIESGIVVGDRVRVTGIVQPAGSLLAHRIERLDEELGCTDIRVKITAINGKQLVLSDGQTIDLTNEIQIEGQLQVSAVVIVRLCVRADGTIVIVNIVVILTPPPPPPPAPPSPAPSGGGQVTICHYPGGNKNKGHTLSVGQAAVSAHLAHGDKLGPCDGGSDNGDDNQN